MQDKEGGIPPPSTLQKQETCFSFAYGKKIKFFLLNHLLLIKNCGSILRTIKLKEELQWKEDIVFIAIRTENNSVRIRILDKPGIRQHS